MKELPLTRGKVALLDDVDFVWARHCIWYASESQPGRFYARRSTDGQYLHKLVLPGVPQVDHRNRITLDCQRENLRPASSKTNPQNMTKWSSRTTSRFKGVSWHKARQKWRAYIVLDGRQRSLGYHQNELDAALAYDRAARALFGAFAALNFPLPGNPRDHN